MHTSTLILKNGLATRPPIGMLATATTAPHKPKKPSTTSKTQMEKPRKFAKFADTSQLLAPLLQEANPLGMTLSTTLSLLTMICA